MRQSLPPRPKGRKLSELSSEQWLVVADWLVTQVDALKISKFPPVPPLTKDISFPLVSAEDRTPDENKPKVRLSPDLPPKN